MVRKTVTLDEDVARLLEQENRRAGEAMKLTVNRVLRAGLVSAAHVPKRGRFVVEPFDTAITSEQWKNWKETKMEEILEQAEMPLAR